MGAVICYNDSWIYAHLSHDNYFESFPPHVKRLKRFMQLCVCVCVFVCVYVAFYSVLASNGIIISFC